MLDAVSGTLTLNGTTTVGGDTYFGGTLTHNGSNYYAAGDVIASSSATLNNLVLNGKTSQELDGTLNVTNLTNTNAYGGKVSGTVNVSRTLTGSAGTLSGNNIILLSGGAFGGDTYNGNVTVQSACTLPSEVNGNMTVSAGNTISRDTAVNGSLTSSAALTLSGADISISKAFTNSGTVTSSNSSITVNGAFTNSSTISGGSVTLNGISYNSGTLSNTELTTYKEISNTGKISGGSFTAYNDILNDGTLSVDTLTLIPKAIILVNGNSPNVGDLALTGSGQVKLDTAIYVSGNYKNDSVSVNEDNIIIASGKTYTSDKTYSTLNVTTDLIIDGCTLTADTLNAEANITLTNGAELIVNKQLNASGSSSSITVDETSRIESKKLTFLSSYTSVDIDGELIFGGDTSLSSVKLGGDGTVYLYGDLYGSSLTVNQPAEFNIAGKTPQTVSASGACFGNLNITNKSVNGVTFPSTVYCYGSLNTNGCKITGTVTQK